MMNSYPVDIDFFARVEQLFVEHPNAAIFGASVRGLGYRCRRDAVYFTMLIASITSFLTSMRVLNSLSHA